MLSLKQQLKSLGSMRTIAAKIKHGKVPMRLTALALICAIGAGSAVSAAALSREYQIVDGDTVVSVRMMSTDTQQILQRAGISLNEGDVVARNDDQGVISITRAFPVTVTADGATSEPLLFTEGTVADALQRAGIELGENDIVTPDADTPLTDDIDTVNVIRRHVLTVLADGQTQTFVSAEGARLEAILSAHGIHLDDDDLSSLPLDTQLSEDMELTVTRVSYDEVTTTEEVPYQTVKTQSSELYEGQTRVQTSGVNGVRTIVTRNRVENGQVTASEVLSDEITTAPVDEVILVGTKKRPAAAASASAGSAQVKGDGTLIDQNGNMVAYTAVYTGTCTAYSAAEGAITASGRPAGVGYVAVNPNLIPYGTRLYICSPDGSYVYGYAIAADTGGAALNGTILSDLFYNTVSECYSFGRRTMSVYVLA